MRLRPRLDTALAVFAVLACVAFAVSFVLGLGGGVVSEDTPEPWPAASVVPTVGRVEVLNASGRTGLARHVTGRLRGAGFDVVFFGNAPASAGDSSVVIDRSGDDAVARAAARAMGIRLVRSERDTTLFLDATVIVGVDWTPLAENGAGRSGWRRLLDRVRGGG